MKNAFSYSDLQAQVVRRFAEAPLSVFEPHTTAESLMSEQLDHNRNLEVPEDECEVLQRLLTWMDEQQQLTQHYAQQSTPEARAAYQQQLARGYDQELEALLANAAAYHAEGDEYDDLVPC
jgi:flagellar biosynthesis/type III secretory pathway protein FliH